MEIIILISFVAIQATAKSLPKCATRFAQHKVVQTVAKHHWAVWLVHPAILQGLQDYAVHFVVYRGYVIGH